MTIPAFFDAIKYKPASLASFAESYFFLEGISGRLGFRRFSVLSKADHSFMLQRAPKTNFHAKDLLKTILKVISYLSIILPALILAIKATFRLRHSFRLAAQPINLNMLWKDYKGLHVFERTLHTGLQLVENEKSMKREGERGTCSSPEQHPRANPLLSFENDPAVLFAPLREIDLEKDMLNLQEILKAGFAAGRQMIGILIGNSKLHHMAAAVFCSDGRFRVIDSICGHSVDMAKLTRSLNAARIPLSNGCPIKFQGDFINTHLQKGDNECKRFATLYLYQILKTRDLNAFEDVNGAFAEGMLKRFEDHEAIRPSKRLRDASSVPSASYQSFMLSWVHRCKGLTIDRWQDATLREVVSNSPKPEPNRVGWDIYILGKETFHPRGINRKVTFFIRDGQGREKLLAPEYSWTPETQLGQLIPPHQGMHTVVLYEHGSSKPLVLNLQPGERLFARRADGSKQIAPVVQPHP